MRRLTPVSRAFGFDRGFPIDRYFIEAFLQRHSEDIQGRVLEIGDPGYTEKFGGARVTHSDVLHVLPGNEKATLVGDLAVQGTLPDKVFDCMILTQTFNVIYNMRAALLNVHAALKQGGVLLATFPGISQISRYDMDRWGEYWRFTDTSAKQMFGEVFGQDNVIVETYGNVLIACAYLHGLAADELRKSELTYNDPDYQVVITVRAQKREDLP